MDVVICYCLQCKSELGRFQNSWINIGTTLSIPSYPMLTYTSGCEGVGDSFASQAGSQMQNCALQNLNCKKCQTFVGYRCDNAPAGHLLAKDQLILNMKKAVSAISEATGEKARLTILESLPLINPNAQKPPVPKRASTVQPLGYTASRMGSRINENHASSGSMPPPSNRVKSTPDFSDFKAWAQGAISTQQTGINRISETLINIEGEMQTFRAFMKEVRTELATGREFHQKLIQDRDGLVKVSGKLGQLQNQLNSINQELRGKSGVSLSRDIEIIISDIQQVSEKAYEVDELKIEVGQLNTQVKDMEDVAQVRQVPSEVENLKLELQTLKSRLESIEGAVNQAPSLHSTRQAASSEESQSAQGHPQISKRLPRVEIYVGPPEQPANSTTNLKPRTSASEDLEGKPHNSSLKRKYGDIEKSAPADQEIEAPSLPIKRKKVPQKSVPEKCSQNMEHTSGSSRVRFKSPRPEVIEILSSERGSPPILGEAMENGGINSTRDNLRVDKQLPLKVTPNDASNSISKAPHGKWRKGSVRRTASMNNLATPSTVSVQSRDSQGALITTSGKVDRRSLRYRTSHSNKENATPVQRGQDTDRGTVQQHVSENQASERIQKAHSASARVKRIRSTPNLQSSGVAKDMAGGEPSADVPLLSIERDGLDDIQARHTEVQMSKPGIATAEKSSQAQTIEQASSTPTAANSTSIKPYKCGTCGKGYTTQPFLKQHQRFSCSKADTDERMKNAKLAAREKLVKDTLEREMTAGM